MDWIHVSTNRRKILWEVGPKSRLKEYLQAKSEDRNIAHPIEFNLGPPTLIMVVHILLGVVKGVYMDRIKNGIIYKEFH